jgi:hypothetical protein
MMPPQPPEGTGKMTIATVCKTYGLDMAEVLARLEAKGVTADAGSTFKELAETSGVSPKELYLYVRGE